jgi:hypothetical protein
MNAQKCYLIIVLLSLAAGVHRVTAQTGVSPPSMETNMPSDIDPQSGFRLPLPRREDLDEAGRSAYDRAITPGRTIAGLQGPAGVQLYSPKIASHVAAINQYLRFEAGFPTRWNGQNGAFGLGPPGSHRVALFVWVFDRSARVSLGAIVVEHK